MTAQHGNAHRRTSRRAVGVLFGALALAAPLCAGSSSALAAEPAPAPAGASVTQAHNLIRNGTFATPQVPNLVKSWWHGTYAQQFMKGWEPIKPGWYDLLNAKFAEHPRGYQAVDLGQEFLPNGGIKQTIGTDEGTTYTLSFDHSPNAWANCIGTATDFSVSVLDEESGTEIAHRRFRSADVDGGPHWKSAKMDFVPTGDETTIEFHGNSSVSCQTGITDVWVPKGGNAGG